MSFDLVEMTKSAVGGQVSGKIGGLIGLDEEATGSAVNAAIPVLIGGMIKKTSTSHGASEMFGMLDKFDGGMLDNLGGIFDGGQKQSGMMDMGQKVLALIFGDKLNSILEAIAKLTNRKPGTVSTLLGVLCPVVMSVLGKQKKAAGWDIGNFTSTMAEQKSNLSGIDPALIDGIGIGFLLGPGQEKAAEALGEASKAMGAGVDKAGDMAGHAAQGAGNLMKILLPVILLAAVGFLAWKFLFTGGGIEPGKTKEAPAPAVVALAEEKGAVAKLSGVFEGVTGAIDGIRDKASAELAADKLGGISENIEKLGLGKLSGSKKLALKVAVSGFRAKLDRMLETVYKIPGVEDALKPAIDNLQEKLGG